MQRFRVLRRSNGGTSYTSDEVVVEEPLTIHVRHRNIEAVLGSTMRTPGSDRDLCLGLARAEGVISRIGDVRAVRQCRPGGLMSNNDIRIDLADEVAFDHTRFGRVSHPSSACGICGRDQIEDLVSRVPRMDRCVRVDAGILLGMPDAMASGQSVFRRTGGVHAAALATADGLLLAVAEDVGRHNAVDKVVGRALVADLTADIIVVSGRAGFEIVQKAAMAGIPIIVSVSAPTSLAVEAARASDITLAAFVRGGNMTVYSGESRLQGAFEWART